MYSLTFVILAGFCIYAAISAPWMWLTIVLLYCALSMLLIGVAYLLAKPNWLLKDPRGPRRWASWLAFGPFFALNGLLFHLNRWTSREPQAHEIIPGLLLGRMLTNREADRHEPAPHCIIDLTCEFSEARRFRQSKGYLCVPTLDGTSPTEADLRAGVEMIRTHICNGPVYVHCALGHGRSATMVAAYLILTGQADGPEQAVSMIRQYRASIGLKPSQVRALQSLVRNRT